MGLQFAVLGRPELLAAADADTRAHWTALGVVAVPAGIGGGTLFVPIVGSFFPFHLDFVRGAGLLVALAGGADLGTDARDAADPQRGLAFDGRLAIHPLALAGAGYDQAGPSGRESGSAFAKVW